MYKVLLLLKYSAKQKKKTWTQRQKFMLCPTKMVNTQQFHVNKTHIFMLCKFMFDFDCWKELFQSLTRLEKVDELTAGGSCFEVSAKVNSWTN